MTRVVSYGILAALIGCPLVAQAQLTFPAKVTADAGILNSALVQAGYLDVTLYGADPSGQADSTSAIQQAIDDAMNSAMVTYLPPGTYLVSAPLVGEQVFTSECYSSTYWGKNGVWQAPTLVGPASGPRPVIRLADNSSAFQDASNPLAILHFYNNGPGSPDWSGNPGCQMFSVIRDLNVEVGKGNPGAIGVQNPGTQGCYLENIQVDATGAYAGIEGTPGQAELAVNLTVIGGQYGIIPYWPTSLVGVTVVNQTVAGLDLGTYNSLAVVGFEIDEDAGAAAVINDTYQSQRGQVALIDGTINISGARSDAGAAIQDFNGGHDLYLRNVFVRTPNPLIQSGSNSPVRGSGGLDEIAEYVFTNLDVDDESGEIQQSTTLIDGGFSQAVISNLQLGVSPASVPSDLVLRHLPGPLPWIDDPGVVNAVALGADPTEQTDSTAAIQQAIDQGAEVFLPRGMYQISGTLQLQPNTRLFGVPGNYSQLWASPSWNPDGGYVPFLQTASTADGATYVGDLFIQVPDSTYAQTFIYGLEWQAGRSSLNRQVYPRLPYKNYSSPNNGGFTEAPRDLVHIAGNGGGRFWGLQLSADENGSFDPRMRDILVEGTTAPLTFYAPNPEHTSGPMLEIAGATNVRVLGSKVEGREGLVQDSNNVLVAAFSGHNVLGAGESDWVFSGSTNVVMAASSVYAGGLCTGGSCYQLCEQGQSGDCTYSGAGPSGDLIFDDGPDAGIGEQDSVSLFAIGAFDETPFPHCGDGVCDGAETGANCPADCAGSGATGTTTGSGTSGTSSSSGGSAGASSSGGARWTACATDGGPPDWTTVPRFLIPYTDAVLTGDAPFAPTSNAELSATVQTAWDSATLYVQVQVTEQPLIDSPAALVYYDNAVELYLDEGDTRTSAYDAGDLHLDVAADGRMSPGSEFSSTVGVADGGYLVDFAVPLAAAGGVIGFDVAIDANFDGGLARMSQLMWSGDGGAYLNPQQFGQLALSTALCGVGSGTGTSGGASGASSSGSPSGGGGAGGCSCGSFGDPLGLLAVLGAVRMVMRRRRVS